MAGAADFFPPFSFCAAIISCLLRSASSRAYDPRQPHLHLHLHHVPHQLSP